MEKCPVIVMLKQLRFSGSCCTKHELLDCRHDLDKEYPEALKVVKNTMHFKWWSLRDYVKLSVLELVFHCQNHKVYLTQQALSQLEMMLLCDLCLVSLQECILTDTWLCLLGVYHHFSHVFFFFWADISMGNDKWSRGDPTWYCKQRTHYLWKHAGNLWVPQ